MAIRVITGEVLKSNSNPESVGKWKDGVRSIRTYRRGSRYVAPDSLSTSQKAQAITNIEAIKKQQENAEMQSKFLKPNATLIETPKYNTSSQYHLVAGDPVHITTTPKHQIITGRKNGRQQWLQKEMPKSYTQAKKNIELGKYKVLTKRKEEQKIKQYLQKIKSSPKNFIENYKKYGAKEYAKRIGIGFISIASNYGKGLGKTLNYTQNNEMTKISQKEYNKKRIQKGKTPINFNQEIKPTWTKINPLTKKTEQWFEIEGKYYNDKDVQSFLTLTALAGIPLGKYAKTIGNVFKGKQIHDTIINPTPENIGTSLYMTGAINHLYKIGKKGQIPKEYRKEYKAYNKVIRRLQKKIKVKNIDFNRVDSLHKNPKAQKTIEGYLIKNKKVILGGTTAIESSGTKLIRKPKDLDLYSNKPKNTIKEISTLLKKNKIKHNVVPKGDKIYINGKKAIEVHSIKHMLLPTLRQETIKPKRFLTKKTPKGVKIVDPYLLTRRKFHGAFDQNLERYSKDIPSAINSAQYILKKQIKGKTLQRIKGGSGSEWLKPYLIKGKYERATATPNFYKGKTPNIFAGLKYIKKPTTKNLKIPTKIIKNYKAIQKKTKIPIIRKEYYSQYNKYNNYPYQYNKYDKNILYNNTPYTTTTQIPITNYKDITPLYPIYKTKNKIPTTKYKENYYPIEKPPIEKPPKTPIKKKKEQKIKTTRNKNDKISDEGYTISFKINGKKYTTKAFNTKKQAIATAQHIVDHTKATTYESPKLKKNVNTIKGLTKTRSNKFKGRTELAKYRNDYEKHSSFDWRAYI